MAFDLSSLFAGPAILVFTHDQFVLRGALVHKKDNVVEIIAEAASQEQNPDTALMEVLEGLKEIQKKLPKKAILATAAMVSGVFEIPVDPKKPKPFKQMHELVKWELAELLGEHNEQWTLGAIAVGLGYMTSEQRREVVNIIAEKRENDAGGRAPRFGDICLSEKFLRNEQHEVCLDIQEQLSEPDDDLICAWKPFTLEAEDEVESHNWLCSGLGRFYRNQWARAFKTEGIKLSGFAPMNGLAMGLLAKPLKDNESTLLLELHHNQVFCFQIKKDDLGRDGVVRLRSEPRKEGELDVDMLADLCLEYVNDSLEQATICMPYEQQHADEVIEVLEARLDRPVKRLSSSTKASGVQYALAGVAGNLLYSSQNKFLLQVPAHDPPPPLWKNPAMLRLAVPALLFAAIGGNEVFMRVNTAKMKAELKAMSDKVSDNKELSSEVAQARSEASRLKAEIKQLTENVNTVTKEVGRLQTVYERSTLPVEVLEILGRTITEEVMIEKFIEPARSKTPGYHLHAWAVDDVPAQQFVTALGRNMMDINYQLFNPSVGQEKNRYNVSGFGIDLWVIPVPHEEPEGKKKK